MNERNRRNEPLLVEESKGGRVAISREQKGRFLRALAVEHHVGAACKIAGFSPAAAYRFRNSDPDFKRLWDAALEALPVLVQDAAVEEGLHGQILRDDEGRPVLDADGNELRVRNIPVLRDLMKKYMGIPSGNQVNVQVGGQDNTVILPEALPPEQLREINRRLYGKEVIDAEYEEVDDDQELGVEDLL